MAPQRQKRLVVSLVLVSLLLCVQQIISAPLQSADDDSQVVKLQYKTGGSYVYDFSSDVVTKLVGTSDDESRIKVKGQALLTARTPTEFILTVTKASFETPSGQTLSGTNSKLEGTAIGFTNENGVLKCTVQLQKDDATWSANVKRALASLFTNYAYQEGQYPAVSYSELDVSGKNCQTQYIVTGNKYEKTRDLNTCAKRDGSFSTSQAATYTVEQSDAPQTDTTIKSNQVCTQEFSSGILRSTECTETHKLTPFSSGDAGAVTTVKSSLTFVEESNAILKVTEFDESREYKIFFDFADEDKASASIRTANAIALLKDLCKEVSEVITSSEVADKYARLKKQVAKAPESGLREAYDGLNGGSICADAAAKKKLTKLYLSAVAAAGSSDSITFFSDLYNDNNVVDDRLQRIFRLSLAFAVRPRDNALNAVKKLLDAAPSNRLIVTSGGLAHQFCHANPKCETNDAYKSFVGSLASYAEKSCLSSDPKQVTDAIAGLQALGNLHELTPAGEKVVIKCLGGINRIRINALQAFRSNPCARAPLEKARELFHDLRQPAHIRIHAYIALSKCFSSEEADRIVETLKSPEEVDQVKNFVCTSAQNAVDTVSPGRTKPQLQEAFDKIKCTEYKKDVRRFSANIESSSYESDRNLGYSTEANIIYTPDTFVPKTLSANFTFDHAGKSYNFLEVGVNDEGYEKYLGNVFGPKGKKPQQFDAPANYGFVARSKRAVSSAPAFNQGKLDTLQNQLALPTSARDEPGVSDFYIRIWGITIFTKTVNEDELVGFYKSLHAPKSKEDRLRNLLVNHDIELTDQIPLPSDKLILPTVSGLPLKLAIDGSVILSLNMHSKFDENTLSLNGNWVASVNSVVRGKQTVGAGPVSAGIQVEVTSFGTHNSGFTLAVKRGEAESATIDAKVLLPETTVRSFSVTSRIYLVESKNYELPTKKELAHKTPATSISMGMGSSLFDVFTSVSVAYPSVDRSLPDVAIPKFPLSGPVTVEGKLQVTDPAVKELAILLDYKTNEAKDDRSLKLVLDTPGSKVNRRIEANLKFKKTGPGNVEQEASYVSERVKAFVFITDKTSGTVNDKEFKVSYNGKEYGVKVHSDLVEEEEQISALVKTTKLQFDASYYTPGGSGTLIKGNAVRSKKVEDDKTSGKLTLNAETSTPVQKSSASGTIEWEKQNDGSGYKLVLTDVQGEHDKFGKYGINGKIESSKATNSFSSDITAKYGKGTQHELNIVANVDRSKENRAVVEAKLTSSRRPELNFDLKYERDFSVEPKKLSFVLNKGERSIGLTGDYAKQGDGFVFNADFNAKGPSTGGFSVTSKVSQAGQKLDSETTVKSSAFNVVSKLNSDYAAETYNLDASGNGFGQDFTFASAATKSGDTRKRTLTINAGNSFDLDFSTEMVVSETKGVAVVVVSSNKFLTQPYTIRTELYPKSVFKNKVYDPNAELKKTVVQVLRGQDRITNLIAEKTAPGTYKIEIYQQNVIEATLESGFSKGNVVFDTDINIPSKRRVISNFEVKGSSAGVEITTEVKWDANKDPTKVFSFKSKSSKNGVNIVSKNSVDISGEARELNIETKLEPQLLNADHTFSVEYITAKKSYSFGIDSRVDFNDKVRGIKLGLKADLPGQKPLNFKIDSQYTTTDAEKYFFDYYLDYIGDISDDDVKDQFLKLKISQRPVNGGRSLNIEASGRIISDTPKGISLQIDAEPGPVKSVKVKYVRKDGDTKVTGIDASLSHDKANPEKVLAITLKYDKFTGKPTTADVTYRYTFNSFRDFEITETFNVAYQTFSSSGENTLKVSANDFLFKTISRLAKGDEAPKTIQDIEVNAGSANGKYKILADVRNLFTNPLGAADDSPSKIIPKFEIEVEPKLPSVKVSFTAERLPKVGNVQLTIDHNEAAVSGGQKRTTNIKGTVGDQSADFTSALEFSRGKAATDFSIKINNDPERKLSVLVQDSGSGPTAEASVSWGSKPNESIKTKGTVVKTANGGFDADLNFDKTPVTNQWSLKITRSVESDKKAKFVFNAESPDSKQILKISLDRNIDLAAQSSIKVDYEISLLKYVTGKHVGKLQIDLDRKAFAPASGTQLTIDFDGSKDGQVVDKTKIVVRASDSEKRLTVSSDCAKPYCVDANFGLTTTENAGALEFTIVRDNIKTGLIIEGSKSPDYETVKSDVQVFFARDKQQEDFGVAFYKEPGQADDVNLVGADLPSAASKLTRVGLDVHLDDRTISVVSGHGAWEGSLKASACQLNFFLDKKRKPNEKFAYLLAKIKESGNKRNFLFVTSAPVSEKTFRVKTTRVFQTIQDFELKVELDVFQKKEDTLTVTVKRFGDASNDVWDSSAISEGLGIANKQNCIFQTNGDSQTADCTTSLKSPGATDASFKFTSNCSPQTKTVKFDQLTPDKKSYYINAEFNDAGCLKRLDYILPGFTAGDARSIKIEKSEVPRGYILKTSLKSEGDDFTELFLGQVVARGLGIKLTRTEKGARNDLLEIRRVENSTYLRSYEFLWNADNIKKSLSRLEAIGVQRSDNFATLLRQRAEEIRKRHKGIQESYSKASIDADPALEYIQNNVEQIAKELRVDPSKAIKRIQAMRAGAKRLRETIRESFVAKTLETIANLVQSGKDTVPQTVGKIRGRLEELAGSPDIDLDALYTKQYSAGLRQFLAKLKAVNDKVYKKQQQNPAFDKVAKLVRGQLASMFGDLTKNNQEAHFKAFPYPEAHAAYEPFMTYIRQRLATPEKQTLNDDFREMMLAKADAGGKATFANALYTRFASGHAVLNIPVLTQFPFIKQFLTVSRSKKGFSSGLLYFRGNFPAAGHATIYGTTAFRTFDGQVVPFSGPNQYLLTFDAQKQFSVVVDISKNGDNEEKSVYVSDGKDKAVITQDGTVFLNGKRAIRGVKSGSLEVIREGYFEGVRINSAGVTVVCQKPGRFSNLSELPCIVRISGYYNGRVAGALGNFNNDQHDDPTSVDQYILK